MLLLPEEGQHSKDHDAYYAEAADRWDLGLSNTDHDEAAGSHSLAVEGRPYRHRAMECLQESRQLLTVEVGNHSQEEGRDMHQAEERRQNRRTWHQDDRACDAFQRHRKARRSQMDEDDRLRKDSTWLKDEEWF